MSSSILKGHETLANIKRFVFLKDERKEKTLVKIVAPHMHCQSIIKATPVPIFMPKYICNIFILTFNSHSFVNGLKFPLFDVIL